MVLIVEKTKQELQQQIDAARKQFYAGGRKTARLRAVPVEKQAAVKPRQQRLGLFS